MLARKQDSSTLGFHSVEICSINQATARQQRTSYHTLSFFLIFFLSFGVMEHIPEPRSPLGPIATNVIKRVKEMKHGSLPAHAKPKNQDSDQGLDELKMLQQPVHAHGGVDDLTQLAPLCERTILDSLKTRFKSRLQPYSFAGLTLVSVNPFEPRHDLYSFSTMHQYRELESLSLATPHVYAIVEKALRSMTKKNQTIVCYSYLCCIPLYTVEPAFLGAFVYLNNSLMRMFCVYYQ